MLTPVIVIALFGLATWAVCYFIPMTPKIKQAVLAVAGVILFAYLRWSGVFQILGIPTMIIDVVSAIAMTGLFVWLVVLLIPMPEKFKTAIYVVAGVLLLLWLLNYFRLFHGGVGSLRATSVSSSKHPNF